MVTGQEVGVSGSEASAESVGAVSITDTVLSSTGGRRASSPISRNPLRALPQCRLRCLPSVDDERVSSPVAAQAGAEAVRAMGSDGAAMLFHPDGAAMLFLPTERPLDSPLRPRPVSVAPQSPSVWEPGGTLPGQPFPAGIPFSTGTRPSPLWSIRCIFYT